MQLPVFSAMLDVFAEQHVIVLFSRSKALSGLRERGLPLVETARRASSKNALSCIRYKAQRLQAANTGSRLKVLSSLQEVFSSQNGC